MRYWTTHWQYRYWQYNREGHPITASGSNLYRTRGVAVEDIVYVVSISDGQLYLGGRMTVSRIVSRAQAVRIRGNPDLYDADEWIIAKDDSSTLFNPNRRVTPEDLKRLRFVSARLESKPLFFEPGTDRLDRQATRGVRELTPESAALLDRIIQRTDKTSKPGRSTYVSASVPDEDTNDPDLVAFEGTQQNYFAMHRKREWNLRTAKINDVLRKIGQLCCEVPGCGFNFLRAYGQLGKEYAHVHHEMPLGQRTQATATTLQELRIVCANCHAMIHRNGECRSLNEVGKAISLASQEGIAGHRA